MKIKPRLCRHEMEETRGESLLRKPDIAAGMRFRVEIRKYQAVLRAS